MTASKLRAAMTAILLGTVAVGVVSVVSSLPAEAATVSAKVGPLLKEAQSLAQAGNYKGAAAKLDEADRVKSTADDTAIMISVRYFRTNDGVAARQHIWSTRLIQSVLLHCKTGRVCSADSAPAGGSLF